MINVIGKKSAITGKGSGRGSDRVEQVLHAHLSLSEKDDTEERV
jgi:hypothetical protein